MSTRLKVVIVGLINVAGAALSIGYCALVAFVVCRGIGIG